MVRTVVRGPSRAPGVARESDVTFFGSPTPNDPDIPGRTVDVIAVGPCPWDPYDPTAPAWALAAGMATWGDHVRVLHPTGPTTAPAPEGVETLAIELPIRRPGAAVEGAALALAAGRRIRPDAELVVRDPFGLGPLWGARRRGGVPPIGGDRPTASS